MTRTRSRSRRGQSEARAAFTSGRLPKRDVRPQLDPIPDSRRLFLAPTICAFAAFAAVFVTLAVGAYTQSSATWDEPIHLTAGYVALTKHDFRVDPSHPPFLRMWSALPTLFLDKVSISDIPADQVQTRQWLGDAYKFAHRFLYVDNDADRLLYVAKFMPVFLGVLLGILIFLWTREWLGFTPAVIALACYTFEPNLLAHASLVTTDFGVTFFIFGTIYFSWLSCRRLSFWRLAGLLVCFSLALVSKFSAVLLAPIVLALLATAVARDRVLGPRRALAIVAALAAVSVMVIWASYGFNYLPAESMSSAMNFYDLAASNRDSMIAATVQWIDSHRLLPNAYTQGFLYSYASAQQLPGFLTGSYSTEGWWSYFPIAFALKTPTVLIVFVVAGLVTACRRRHDIPRQAVVFILLPVTVFLGIAMWSGINIGLRHILPVYPFLILLAALGARELTRMPRFPRTAALAAAVGLWAAEYATAYPYPLTFFNYLAGGPEHGYRYLADSNLGWGQALKPLKSWMDQNRVTHVNLAYFGQADPTYYGINCTHLPGAPSFATQSIARPRLPGYVAISATTLTGVYAPAPWRLFYTAFRDLEPVAVIGNSIHVYWIERWPEIVGHQGSDINLDTERSLGDALLFAVEWPEHALLHYQRYLAARPGDAGVLVNYGRALVATSRVDDGVAALRRAVDANRNDGLAHVTLGNLLLATRDLGGAAEHAERAVILNPHSADAHLLMGRVHAVQGRLEDAARDFARVIEIDPAQADPREYLRRIAGMRSPRAHTRQESEATR
jgi:tetratricopeptide (TPR) repeat protein